MGTIKEASRRSARRIGVEQGANFDERREIILREAARTFSEKGVQNTSIDDIAARLGVSKPALYHYVSSKDEMVRQCFSMALANYRTILVEAERLQCSALDKLAHVFERWATEAVTDFGRAIVLIDPNALSEQGRKTNLQGHRLILHRIEGLIKEGMDDGSIDECNPAVTTLALMGMFNSPAKWFRKKGPLSLNKAIAAMIKMMKKALAPG